MTARKNSADWDRWRTPEGRALRDEVIARLAAGRPLGDLQLGQVGDLIDLRGLPVPPPSQATAPVEGYVALDGLTRFEDVTWEGLDLSGADMEHLRFFRSRIVDCRIDR